MPVSQRQLNILKSFQLGEGILYWLLTGFVIETNQTSFDSTTSVGENKPQSEPDQDKWPR